MAATQKASVPLDMYNHWSDILNTYEGKECTHISVSRTLDPNGNVIDESQTETTIYAAISSVKEDAVIESAGTLQYGDLTFYALAEENVIVGSQTNASETLSSMIRYEGILYYVEKLVATAYDDSVAVVSRYVLRKVANEV